MCSPRVFPIAPNLKPICFAQNPPLLIYIHGVFAVINPFEERNFIQPMGNVISSQGALVFFLLSFGCKVGRLKGRFFFQVEFSVESGLSMQVLLRALEGVKIYFPFN
jgi:hypothetical protein